MSSLCVSALALILFITAGCDAEATTSSPDYEYDDNSTLRYSFFSNTSSDDLDNFLKDRKHLLDSQEDEDLEERDEEDVGVTTATWQAHTEKGGVSLGNAASSTFICPMGCVATVVSKQKPSGCADADMLTEALVA
ncbi:uncharacterized protein ACBT44_001112 isoform 1-T1 [Syngnathus typhle]